MNKTDTWFIEMEALHTGSQKVQQDWVRKQCNKQQKQRTQPLSRTGACNRERMKLIVGSEFCIDMRERIVKRVSEKTIKIIFTQK